MKKKRILLVVATLNEGGISKYVERTYSKLANYNFEITIMVLSSIYDGNVFQNLNNHGIRIVIAPSVIKNPFKYVRVIRKTVTNYFDIVHMHSDNWINFYPLIVASKRKIKKIIVQSHNSNNHFITDSKLKNSINEWAKRNSHRWITERIAVSKEAANWMFLKNENVKILANPVEVNHFRFKKEYRDEIRGKYHIDNNILFGNVARFDLQKNPLFLIDIFYEIYKLNHNTKLILIGSGPLKKEIIKKIDAYKLNSKVIIVDWTSEIEKYYSAIDEVIFPSLYEGFPLSLLEAQCSGTSILYSDAITSEVHVLNNIRDLSLEEKSKDWALDALSLYKEFSKFNRENAYQEVAVKGFSYDNYLRKLVDFY